MPFNLKKDILGNDLEVGKLYTVKPLPNAYHYPIILLHHEGSSITEIPNNSIVMFLDKVWDNFYSIVLFKDMVGYIGNLDIEFIKVESIQLT